ncbi:MAG: DUF192 domain-containing protein [Deltaproteobacteria bacterium]
MRIINQTKNTILAEDAVIADTIFKRMKGLLGRKELKKGEAIILKPCREVHTFFMQFPIDVIFTDRNHRIIKAISSLGPWHLSGVYFPAKFCVELPAGIIASTQTCEGDTLSFV